MKKDKPFSKRGFLYEQDNQSWSVNLISSETLSVNFGNAELYFCKGRGNEKLLRRFIKALKKGLRRLKRG